MLKTKNKALSIFYFLFGLVLFMPSLARADCTSPAAPAGILEYFSASEQVFKYCNGTDWIEWGRYDSVSGLPAPTFTNTLDDLTDVDATAPAGGACITYSSASGNWETGLCGNLGVEGLGGLSAPPFSNALNDLSDVDAAAPGGGECITYSSATGNWETGVCGSGAELVGGLGAPAFDNTLDNLSDVSAGSPNDGEVLLYSAGAAGWVTGTGGSASAAGADRQIQFNSGGSLGADANFVFDAAGNLGLGVASPAARLHVEGGHVQFNSAGSGSLGVGPVTFSSPSTRISLRNSGSSGNQINIIPPAASGQGFRIGSEVGVGFNSLSISVTGGVPAAETVTVGYDAVAKTLGSIAIGNRISMPVAGDDQVLIGRNAGGVSGGYNGGEYAILLGREAQASANEFGVSAYVDTFSLWYRSATDPFRGMNRTFGIKQSYKTYADHTDYESEARIGVYRDNNTFQEAMKIDSDVAGPILSLSGNVGIGVASPAVPLDVAGTMRAIDDAAGCTATERGAIRFNSADAALELCDGGAWGELSGTATPAGSDRQIQFNSGGGGFGADPDLTWDFATNTMNTINIDYTGYITDLSDRRLKENITPLQNSFEGIMALQGYSFTMKDDESGIVEYGLMAQDVQTVFPELVKTHESGTLSLNYIGLIAPLIETVKAQQKEIEDLAVEHATEIHDLKSRLRALENRYGTGFGDQQGKTTGEAE